MEYLLLILIFSVIAFSIPLLIELLVVAIAKFKISKPHKKNIKAIAILSIPLTLSVFLAINGGEQISGGSVSVYAKGSNIANVYTFENHPLQFITSSITYLLVFISSLYLTLKIYRAMFTQENGNP